MGEKAVVNAEIVVGTAIVMGEVIGTIDAADRIEVYPPGRIAGDIQSPVISIEQGGMLNGNCAMKDRSAGGPVKRLSTVRASGTDEA